MIIFRQCSVKNVKKNYSSMHYLKFRNNDFAFSKLKQTKHILQLYLDLCLNKFKISKTFTFFQNMPKYFVIEF